MVEVQRMVGPLGEPMKLGPGSYRSKAEKVAILLASLDNQIAVDLLKRFAPDEVKQIIESSSELGSLSNSDVEPLITEFTSEFTEALGISAGSREIVSLLESAFSAKDLAKIMGKEEVPDGDTVWSKFKLGMEDAIVPYLLDEGAQTSAFVISMLPSELAARCVSMLPREISQNVVSRMINIGDAAPFALAALMETLSEDFFAKAETGEKSTKIDKMAALVNKLDRQQSADLLEDLGKSNPEAMKTLRKLIFMFEDVERIEQKSRAKLFDRVPTEQVIPALFGTTPELREAILSALGARARRMVESELQGDTSQPVKDTAAARRKIADIAIQLAKSGDIELPEPADGPADSPTDSPGEIPEVPA